MKKPARRPVFLCWIPGLLGRRFSGRGRGSVGGGRSSVSGRRSSVSGRRFGGGGRRFSSGSRRFGSGRFGGSSGFFFLTASGQGSSQQSSQENGIFHLISL